jgi:hypothetical protein
MNSKQILFFSTQDDITPLIKEIELSFSIDYVEMGLFDNNKMTMYRSALDILNLGITVHGDWNRDLRLMIIPKGANVQIRPVVQRKGGIKFAIDPLENQETICIQFGGIYQNRTLIAGKCGTVYFSDFALNIFKKVSALIKKDFIRIGNFYVGPAALNKLKAGWRLTTDEQFPKEYDLQLA